MSTLSSLVLTASSTLTLDFIKPKFCDKMKDKRQLSVIRILILVFIALSAVIAIVQYKHKSLFIAQLMGLSWGAMAGSFLGPYLYGLYCKRISPASVWVSFAFGVGVMVLNTFCPAIFPAWLESPISCGAFVMVADLVLVPLVSLVTRAPDRAFVENVFSCYEKKVVVRAEEAIGDEEA
jgi:SSS family solute:Na+ symporter